MAVYLQPIKKGFVAQLNRASDYGSEGYRFESYRGHHTGLFKFILGKSFLFGLYL